MNESEGDIAPWYLVSLILLGLLTVLLAILAALIERSGPIRLRHWAENARGSLRRLYHRPADFEAFRFLLSALAGLAPVLLLGAAWWLLPRKPQIVSSVVLTAALLLMVVEWINRRLVEWYAEETLAHLTWFYRLFYAILRLPVWLFSGHVAFTEDEEEEDEDDDEASEGEIDAFLDVGVREGIIDPEGQELVRSIVDFGDTQVRSVMTPRVEISAAPASKSLEELAQVFFENKHTRLPLYGESIDQILGILNIRDLFQALHQGSEVDALTLCHPPHYVPETKPLRNLLDELQAMHQQMAIVVDEYGGVAGLVTVANLVEEIFGDMGEEQAKNRHPVELKDGGFLVGGRTHIEDLAELFDVDFDGVPYETVSGFVCGELGYVPKVGQVINTHGLAIMVEEADERLVKSVVVRLAESAEPAAEAS